MKNVNTKFRDVRKFIWLISNRIYFSFLTAIFSSILMKLKEKYPYFKRNILGFRFHRFSHDKHIKKAFCEPILCDNVPRSPLPIISVGARTRWATLILRASSRSKRSNIYNPPFIRANRKTPRDWGNRESAPWNWLCRPLWRIARFATFLQSLMDKGGGFTIKVPRSNGRCKK